ncbi:Energy-coupling factor transporter probable substrate-capture protein CbiN [uncultured Roseburia sp.]|uniref:Cobalt transport protein CbiN n=1 Tax=Brotonthovivens ammoniilytica TaxID=2981725 RepID=A0ABT2TPE4_9FIRM|nr:energy-coupling factor ABC transporter substrate-binding protein [Brotonthovivens ammoniilytica]MCU6763334.1 energy-coupling factor ABC transporter substrate-binding protein [Brotonthovivens ammoniilytica]SCJ13890.1 Energy-coupling factor transporter probable substrate-capture protein CbiN [uncultured Roseburia sp.]
MNKSKHNKTLAIVLIIAIILIALIPLFALKGAEFGGSDDAGSQMVNEITGEEYEPWFTPVLEQALNGELPGEVESLFFCVQTGIGVGIAAFVMGRLVERKKWMKEDQEEKADSDPKSKQLPPAKQP